MKKILVGLIISILFGGVPLANAGSYTANQYFWKPAYRESGPAAYSSYNAALDTTDLFLASLEPLPDLIANWAILDQILTMIPVTCTYSDNNTFTLPGDYTSRFPAGAVVQIQVAAGMVYSTVASSSYAAPTTTVNLNDTVLTDPITRVYVVATRDGLWPNGPGWVMARDYGTDRAALQAADAVATAAGRELRITHAYTIDDDVTLVSPKVTVQPGVPFAVATTKTLTINGTLEAGRYQIFALTGTGAVAGLKIAYPEWFYASGSYHTAYQAALNSLVTNGVCSPQGGMTYSFDAGFTFDKTKTQQLVTENGRATFRMSASFTPAAKLIDISGTGIYPDRVSYSRIQGLTIVGQNDAAIDGFGIYSSYGQDLVFRDLFIMNIKNTALHITDNNDPKVDQIRVYECGWLDTSSPAVFMGNVAGTSSQGLVSSFNVERSYGVGLFLDNCIDFNFTGFKFHGRSHGDADLDKSKQLVLMDDSRQIKFTNGSFGQCRWEYDATEGLTLTDVIGAVEVTGWSELQLDNCSFIYIGDEHGAAYDTYAIKFAPSGAFATSSKLVYSNCLFRNPSLLVPRANTKYVYYGASIGANAVYRGVNVFGTKAMEENNASANIATGQGYVLRLGCAAFDPADGDTKYVGGHFSLPPQAATYSKVRVQRAGILKKAEIHFRNAVFLNATESTAVYLRVNNTTDYTLSAAYACNDAAVRNILLTNLYISLEQDDIVEIKLVFPTFATANPTGVTIGAELYID